MGLLTDKKLDITDIRLEDILYKSKIYAWSGWKDIADPEAKDLVKDLAYRIMRGHISKFLSPADLVRIKNIVTGKESLDGPIARKVLLYDWIPGVKITDGMRESINVSIKRDRKLLSRFSLKEASCSAINFKEEDSRFYMSMDMCWYYKYNSDKDVTFFAFDIANLQFESLL